MYRKIRFHLPKPLPASNDCLPHAAMNLGSGQGMGLRPPALVTQLIIEPQFGNYVLYRLDATTGFVGDTWHGSMKDALWQVKKEFGVDLSAQAQAARDDDEPEQPNDAEGAPAHVE